MISRLVAILGEYVPLNGEGIASLNPVWFLEAILLVMCIWVSFKLLLKFFDWVLK